MAARAGGNRALIPFASRPFGIQPCGVKTRHWIAFLLMCLPACAAAAGPWFGIRVVDEETGEGLPLAELRVFDKLTDSMCMRDSLITIRPSH